MAKRQVFFSFHYDNDCWRAAQVRNMGKVSEDSTFSDNDWEEVKNKSDKEIKIWIDEQLKMRSCLIVLIGEKTSERKWVRHEIKRAYELNKGMIGIYIHNLLDDEQNKSNKGQNPFDEFTINGKSMSNYVKCFDSRYSFSKDVYQDIKDNIEELIEYSLANNPKTW